MDVRGQSVLFVERVGLFLLPVGVLSGRTNDEATHTNEASNVIRTPAAES